jgi:hypothetical protein
VKDTRGQLYWVMCCAAAGDPGLTVSGLCFTYH